MENEEFVVRQYDGFIGYAIRKAEDFGFLETIEDCVDWLSTLSFIEVGNPYN